MLPPLNSIASVSDSWRDAILFRASLSLNYNCFATVEKMVSLIRLLPDRKIARLPSFFIVPLLEVGYRRYTTQQQPQRRQIISLTCLSIVSATKLNYRVHTSVPCITLNCVHTERWPLKTVAVDGSFNNQLIAINEGFNKLSQTQVNEPPGRGPDDSAPHWRTTFPYSIQNDPTAGALSTFSPSCPHHAWNGTNVSPTNKTI
jgi:hypothetical protein